MVYIVDGQQRLTTTIILMSLIRDKFEEISEDNLATGIQNFLVAKDADNKDRFVLEHTPPNPFFQNTVMLRNGDKEKLPETSEEEKIGNAKKQLSKLINIDLASINKELKIYCLK